jgi:hypothetical protein
MTALPPARRRSISELLQSGEQTWLDWKKAFSPGLVGGAKNPQWDTARGALLKDVVSVANSIVDECGYVVYGVEDFGSTRTPVGLAGVHFDDATFQDWNRATFDPPIEFHYSEIAHDQVILGLCEITPSSDYPHVCKKTVGDLHEGQVWFRKGTRNTVALHRDLQQRFSPQTPLRTTQYDGELVRQVKATWEPRGWVCVWESVADVDEKVAHGYRIATGPENRREIRLAPSNVDSHVLMLRKKT